MDPNNIQPGGMMPPQGAEMATPAQRQELLDMVGNVRGKMGEFEATRKAGEDKIEGLRQESLKMVFELLASAGVDLEDQASVAEFLAKLKENDPQLATWFEEAIGMMLGDTNEEPQGPVDLPTGAGLNEMNYEEPNTIEETPQNLP